MERFISLLVASVCTAPLFYFLVSGLVFVSNKGLTGDSGLAVAYLGTWGGFLAAFAGFFVVWFLARYFLVENYLRYIQIYDGMALVAWLVLYLSWTSDQPYTLDYSDRRAVLSVEARLTKSFLKGAAIDSLIEFQYIGQDLDEPHPDRIREEGEFVILPWDTTPLEANKWEVRVFVRNKPVDFMLNIPRRPQQSTDWSGWTAPAPGQQDELLPADVQQNFTIRYRFRLIPYGAQE
ncbi:hypothetical protein [Larkinella rosea]|uniref:Uncharacterized protein n=1 Tax=Larkinella rosea TaxID=2025312 RepID=A0A3P1BUH9_9BACT|nr:hypothetical protein [Larkinella rosea]RRB04760.1 hypothetical protein EHT25_14940 [Larkinella rosea]